MENNAGVVVEGGDQWSSLSGNNVHEEADFMAQLFPNCDLNNQPVVYHQDNGYEGGSSLALGLGGWNTTTHLHHHHHPSNNQTTPPPPTTNASIFSDASDSYSFPQTGTGRHDENEYYLSNNNNTQQFLTGNVVGFYDCLNLEMSCGATSTAQLAEESAAGPSRVDEADSSSSAKHHLLKREAEMLAELDLETDQQQQKNIHGGNSANNSRKRARVSDVQKGKRNSRSKKNQKLSIDVDDEDESNNVGGLSKQMSGICSSEDEQPNASQDLNGSSSLISSKTETDASSNGKTRASRGSATDPQSLYARKRREKINERLRILQKLVPNGTKVDISTMLEEAVQYVKFLQLQIKLLSSDDLWMYAPLAYNGMDIGLDLQKINAPR